MRKYYIITSIVLFIGMVMTGLGFVNGGLKNIEFRNGRVEVAEHDEKDVTKTVKPFKRVVIDTQEDNVKILYGDKYAIKTSGFNNKEVTINDANDTLEIKHHERNQEIGISLVPSDENGIEVIIPRNTKLDEIKVDSQEGMLDINDDLVSILKIRASDSAVTLSNVNLQKTSFIDAEDTRVNIRDSKLTETNISGNDGDTHFQQVDFRGHNNLSVTDGSANIAQVTDIGVIFSGGEDSKITYQGKVTTGNFKQNENNDNLINISAQDSKVEIQ